MARVNEPQSWVKGDNLLVCFRNSGTYARRIFVRHVGAPNIITTAPDSDQKIITNILDVVCVMDEFEVLMWDMGIEITIDVEV